MNQSYDYQWGKAPSFQLRNVTLAFEEMGEIYARPDEYRIKSSIVIDVGGLNCTLCQFSDIYPLINTMVVSDLGISVLKGKIEKVINERTNLESILKTTKDGI